MLPFKKNKKYKKYKKSLWHFRETAFHCGNLIVTDWDRYFFLSSAISISLSHVAEFVSGLNILQRVGCSCSLCYREQTLLEGTVSSARAQTRAQPKMHAIFQVLPWAWILNTALPQQIPHRSMPFLSLLQSKWEVIINRQGQDRKCYSGDKDFACRRSEVKSSRWLTTKFSR